MWAARLESRLESKGRRPDLVRACAWRLLSVQLPWAPSMASPSRSDASPYSSAWRSSARSRSSTASTQPDLKMALDRSLRYEKRVTSYIELFSPRNDSDRKLHRRACCSANSAIIYPPKNHFLQRFRTVVTIPAGPGTSSTLYPVVSRTLKASALKKSGEQCLFPVEKAGRHCPLSKTAITPLSKSVDRFCYVAFSGSTYFLY